MRSNVVITANVLAREVCRLLATGSQFQEYKSVQLPKLIKPYGGATGQQLWFVTKCQDLTRPLEELDEIMLKPMLAEIMSQMTSDQTYGEHLLLKPKNIEQVGLANYAGTACRVVIMDLPYDWFDDGFFGYWLSFEPRPELKDFYNISFDITERRMLLQTIRIDVSVKTVGEKS